MKKDDWVEALREHVRGCRARAPIPARETLSPEEEWHCRVVGGELPSTSTAGASSSPRGARLPCGPGRPTRMRQRPACGSIEPGRGGESCAGPPASTSGNGTERGWCCSRRRSREPSSERTPPGEAPALVAGQIPVVGKQPRGPLARARRPRPGSAPVIPGHLRQGARHLPQGRCRCRGLSQRSPGNRAKSESALHKVKPCSSARAARCASGTRLASVA